MTVTLDRRMVLAGGISAWLAACSPSAAEATQRQTSARARALIAAARRQIGVTVAYAPGYAAIAYPAGDVPRDRGVCTDVVIRAYRDALNVDLQREVHEDMARAFAEYPRRWGLKRTDRNIDHRRVPNLEKFWQRKGARLALPADPLQWQPGDVFSSLVSGNLPHTGIVSDRLSAGGTPMVIHNIGAGAREEELSNVGRLIGRFRWQL
jgi:uncharacterized protein